MSQIGRIRNRRLSLALSSNWLLLLRHEPTINKQPNNNNNDVIIKSCFVPVKWKHDEIYKNYASICFF